MLGFVVTEFIELVEDKFSPEMADAVITDAAPPHGGAYTAVMTASAISGENFSSTSSINSVNTRPNMSASDS